MVGKWGMWKFYQGARFHMVLTPLNHDTTARYNACQMNGGHHPSGQTVMRDIDGRLYELKICAGCECPYGGPKRSAVRLANRRGGENARG